MKNPLASDYICAKCGHRIIGKDFKPVPNNPKYNKPKRYCGIKGCGSLRWIFKPLV